MDSLLNGTFSAEMLSSEPKDGASAEESNGTLEEKQTSEQENDNMTEAQESHHPPEQETMEIVSQDPDYKESKEKGSKKDYVSVKSPTSFIIFLSEFHLALRFGVALEHQCPR